MVEGELDRSHSACPCNFFHAVCSELWSSSSFAYIEPKCGGEYLWTTADPGKVFVHQTPALSWHILQLVVAFL